MGAVQGVTLADKAVYSTAEAGAYINVQESEIRRLCKSGALKSFKSGPNYKIPKRVLDDAVMEWAMRGVSLSDL